MGGRGGMTGSPLSKPHVPKLCDSKCLRPPPAQGSGDICGISSEVSIARPWQNSHLPTEANILGGTPACHSFRALLKTPKTPLWWGGGLTGTEKTTAKLQAAQGRVAVSERQHDPTTSIPTSMSMSSQLQV